MKIAIHQSQYIPWAPYFKKIAAADVFVLMDNVQYQKNGVQNRNQIRNKERAFWLTIPVTGHLEDLIKDKKLADARWRRKHWRSLEEAYAKAPFWKEHEKALAALYDRAYATLGEVTDAFFDGLMDFLSLKTEVRRLSQLDVPGSASQLVLGICRKLGADTYVSGTGAKSYLKEAEFERAGIKIEYLESRPPVYPQFHGGAFIPGLSVLDLLLNVGRAGARSLLAA